MERQTIAVIFDSKMCVKAWYVNPSLKFFKLDGKFHVDINGDNIYTITTDDEYVSFDLRGLPNLVLKQNKLGEYEFFQAKETDLFKRVKEFVE